jgi:hypothetical protein
MGRPLARLWPPFGPARAALRAALRAAPVLKRAARGGRAAGQPSGRPSGRPSGPQGGPVGTPSDARREARCSWVCSHGGQQGGAVTQRSARARRSGFAKQEVDAAGVERVDAHSAQMARASLLPRASVAAGKLPPSWPEATREACANSRFGSP